MASPVALVLLVAGWLLAGPAAAVPFLVAELPDGAAHGDSYVIELDDPAAIAHARDLVARGAAAGETIVFARIAPGADGVNRDWLAPGRPEWSWHVTGFLGFGDIGAELYDGWPGFVESDVAGWIANTEGTIGSWQYTIVRELPVPEPGGCGALALGAAVLGVARRRRLAPDGFAAGRQGGVAIAS
jgi:hypothetical protein